MKTPNSQNIFINNELKNNLCSILKENELFIDKIDKKILSKILKYHYNNGPLMKSVLCFFNFLLNQMKHDINDVGIKKISPYIKNLIKEAKHIGEKSQEGTVYNINFLSKEIDIIFKTPNIYNDFYNEIIEEIKKEYFIGMFVINNLRYHIPNFMYTFGLFNSPIIENNKYDNSFLAIEKINGNNTHQYYKNISTTSWLVIFMQLLLSLEFSQKEICFTHFDLHQYNVMLRGRLKDEDNSYSFLIGNKEYNVIKPEQIPTIIDYGLACVRYKNNFIGSFRGFEKYGMLNFMVQGYDMLKFLLFSAYHAKYEKERKNTKLYNLMVKLMKFYGNNDKYNIEKKDELNKAVREFSQKGTYSIMATYTPLMFFDWIYDNFPEVHPYFLINERKKAYNIKYSNIISEYNKLTNNLDNNPVKQLLYCLKYTNSYILYKYNHYILSNLYKNTEKIVKSEDMLKYKINELKKQDLKFLNKIFDIKNLPSQNKFNILVEETINTPIRLKNKQKIYKKVDSMLSFYNDIESTLKMYYTILELKLQDEFKDWIDKFTSSYIYNFYNTNYNQLERIRRWSITLKESEAL